MLIPDESLLEYQLFNLCKNDQSVILNSPKINDFNKISQSNSKFFYFSKLISYSSKKKNQIHTK